LAKTVAVLERLLHQTNPTIQLNFKVGMNRSSLETEVMLFEIAALFGSHLQQYETGRDIT
jgi:hypothetical protein